MSLNGTDQEPVQIVKRLDFEHGQVRAEKAHLPLEAALEIVVNGRPHSLLMRTPGADEELVTGYLYTEGLIDDPAEISSLEFSIGPEFLGIEGLRARVILPKLASLGPLPERLALSLSSCGLCGKEALEQSGHGLSRIKSKQVFDWQVLERVLPDLRRHQPLYELTRGVHAAAIYREDGGFLGCFEDIGRHNALDKVIGQGLRSGWPMSGLMVILSGRASLEMVLKAVRAGLPLLICFSAPSLLAVEAAKVLNLTLVGRREERALAAYTHPRRLKIG